MSLIFEHVSYQYATGTPWAQNALHDVSFTIQPGEVVGIAGRTGSGKSTLAQLAANLIQPDSGIIQAGNLTFDQKANPPRKQVIGQVGLVFQYPETQLFGETVEEDVGFGPKNRGYTPGKIKQAVRSALKSMGFDESYLARSPYMLSGGEKRRVAMAGILAMSPQILILDEPTAGLDAQAKADFHKMLQQWRQQQDRIVLWISHDMTELSLVAQRVLIMEQGSLLWDGSLAEALRQPEIWRRAGLARPKAAELVQTLAAKGWDIDTLALTPAQAAAAICRSQEVARGKK